MNDETSRSPRPGEPTSPQYAAGGWQPDHDATTGWNQPHGATSQDHTATQALPGYGGPGAAPPPYGPGGAPPAGGPGPRRGGLLLGAVVLALVVGLVAGGVGGVIGYQLRNNGSFVGNVLSQPAAGGQPALNLPAGSVEQVAQKVTPSVVQIRVRDAQTAGEGSGIVISSDGLILTNNHVIEAAANGGQATAVMQNGQVTPVQIIGRAPTFDIAVVKAQNVSGLTPVDLGRSDNLVVGQGVVAIGSPLGLSGTVTSGIISALDRPVRAGGEESGQDTVLDALQTDAAINPGNSGGPLVDMSGRVIGLNSAIASIGTGSGQAGSIGLGFAIPIDQAKRIADELVRTGHATQALLGVSVPAGQPEDGGAKIQTVVPGGGAAAAGLKPGETITKVNNRVIDSGDALVAAIRSQQPGSQITLTVKDNSEASRQVQVTLGSQQVGTR
jgi:putative serine protease PepD